MKNTAEVCIGQVWRDLDPRHELRHCVVTDVADGKAVMQRCKPDGIQTGKLTKVAIARVQKRWELANE